MLTIVIFILSKMLDNTLFLICTTRNAFLVAKATLSINGTRCGAILIRNLRLIGLLARSSTELYRYLK